MSKKTLSIVNIDVTEEDFSKLNILEVQTENNESVYTFLKKEYSEEIAAKAVKHFINQGIETGALIPGPGFDEFIK